MEKNNTSEEKNLSIIMEMVSRAKSNIEDSSFYYLLWGWLVFAASTLHYALLKTEYDKPWMPWLLMPVGGIITMVYGMKQSKNQKYTSYVDDFMKYVLIAFLISLCTVLFFMSKLHLNTYPVILIIYGNWLFVSGGSIKFIPLVIGGIINWVAGIIAFFVAFDLQLLLLAAAVLLGYILPGYLLKVYFKKTRTAVNI